MSLFKSPLGELEAYSRIHKDREDNPGPIKITGLPDSAKAHIISELEKSTKPWKLVITYSDDRISELADDCRCFMDRVYIYPARDLLFYSADVRGNLISKQRIDVWKHMSCDEGGCIVTTADALLDKLEDADKWRASVYTIRSEDTIDVTELSKKLTDMGYERVSEVDDRGQYTIRGGIIDIYPLTEELPVRIELWDDQIDSIRTYDPESQRSIEKTDSVTIYPAKELDLGGSSSFLRYMNKKTSLVYIDEPDRVYQRLLDVEKEYTDGMSGRIESGQIEASEVPSIYTADEIIEDLNTDITICLTGLDHVISQIDIAHSYEITAKSTGSYSHAFEMLIEDLKKYKRDGYRVVLLTASRTRVSRLAENLREYELSAYADIKGMDKTEGNQLYVADDTAVGPGEILVTYGNLHRGFIYDMLKFVVISESDIYGSRKKKRYKKRTEYEGSKISSLSELSIGDYVVHEDHGIGIYRGIEKIVRENSTKDYIKIEYQGGDNCYIPATGLDIIQKYAGAEAKKPKLNKLGGVEWNTTKSRVKSAVAQIARDLVILYADRLHGKGYVYGPDTVWQKEFEELFAYDETQDQMRAIEDTKADLESDKIMDRLICGDVGYGKTEVALRAAFKVIQEGKQVIYLVPTTILAMQHYNTFMQRMKDFPVRVELLCRFRSPAQQKKTLEDFHKGLVDIIIGTHRVLSKDIMPKDLGLLVIDEEQRFGVAHKEKLKKLREDVDVLTLTATPIPRTLHMSLVGIRDMSVLEEPPQDRNPIQTYVMEYYDETVKEAIKREVARGGQCYYVYNRVNNIAEVSAHLQALMPDVNIAYAHGQMRERELEQIMLDFVNGDIDVLVSTTIIETGLDIPNVNTIIIRDADRLGLSQLYQLRGRVGRSGRLAYAFLLYKREKLLSEEAQKRLKAIKEFTELGSGIKIAMRDLEIRGAGNVLGSEQHGHMQAVGYDLYCKMLGVAVKALKGERDESDDYETSVDADTDAYIPSAYIPSEEQKLDIYKRIASIETGEDMMDMEDELMDRYGEIPKSVGNLLKISGIRATAHRAYVTEVNINKQEIRIKLYNKAKIDPEKLPDWISKYKGQLLIRPGKEVVFLYTERKKQYNCDEMLTRALELVEELTEML